MKAKSLAVPLGALLLVAALWFGYRQWAGPGTKAKGSKAEQQSAGAFEIGLLVPQEGPLAAYGQHAFLGATAGVESVNKKGGILGKPVSLVVRDTKSSPEDSALAAQELITRGVQLILAADDDEATRAALELTQPAGMPLIYLLDGRCKTCDRSDTTKPARYVWGAGLTREAMAEPLLIFLSDKFSKPERDFSFFYLSGEDAELRATTSLVRATAESLGFKTLDDQYFDLRVKDYYTILRDILAHAPDILFIDDPGEPGALIVQQAAKLGLPKEMVISGLSTFNAEELPKLGRAAEGAFTVGRYTSALSNPNNEEFLQAFHAVPGAEQVDPGASAAAAYGTIFIAKAGYERAGARDAERFADAMNDLEVPFPSGKVIVSRQNHMFTQPMFALQIRGGRHIQAEYLG